MNSKKLRIQAKPNKPEGFDLITSFSELEQKAQNFAEGKYKLLIVSGPPGVSKSTIFKNALDDAVGRHWAYLKANVSPGHIAINPS